MITARKDLFYNKDKKVHRFAVIGELFERERVRERERQREREIKRGKKREKEREKEREKREREKRERQIYRQNYFSSKLCSQKIQMTTLVCSGMHDTKKVTKIKS